MVYFRNLYGVFFPRLKGSFSAGPEVSHHGNLMHLYCDSAILGFRVALRMQRLAFEFPEWAGDGIDKELENCEKTFGISAGMEARSVFLFFSIL